jgi:hypothetical protein
MPRMPRTEGLSSRRSSSLFTVFARLTTCLALVGMLASAQPSAAAWEGSTAEDVTAKTLDAVIVRPLATVRVIVGAVFLIPASLLASPSGKEGISAAYDVLVVAPKEYAFDRKLGEF